MKCHKRYILRVGRVKKVNVNEKSCLLRKTFAVGGRKGKKRFAICHHQSAVERGETDQLPLYTVDFMRGATLRKGYEGSF